MRRVSAARNGRKNDERGAVAIIMAMLVGGGLLLGCVALTVDVGSLTSQRREVQNAADAVALSAAQTCAKTGTCPTKSDAALVQLAHDNDAASTITELCYGSAAGDCPVDGSLADCPQPATPFDGTFVRAYTHRHTTYSFAPAIGGGDGRDQQTCATVGWGNAGSVKGVLPVTIPQCDFEAVIGSPPDFTSTQDVAIAINADHTDCAGQAAPSGGKGWLDGDCSSITATVGSSNPGAGKGPDCLEAMVGSVVYLPIYDSAAAGGNNGSYHILGVAGFYLDGVSAPSLGPFGNTGTPHCPKTDVNSGPGGPANGNACIWGYFTTAVAPVGSIDPSAPDLGLKVIQMIG